MMSLDPLVSVDWLKEYKNEVKVIGIYDPLISEDKDINATCYIEGALSVDFVDFCDGASTLPNTFPNETQFNEECQKLGIHESDILVVYDNRGIYWSPRLWWMLKVMGHREVYVLDGGLPAWVAANGRCVNTPRKENKRGNFEGTLTKEAIVTIAEIEANTIKQKFLVLDARSAGRYNNTAPDPRKGLRSGHIPKSVNLPYYEVLNNGKMRKKSELERIFQERVKGSQKLVFSCGSGVTACILYLAAERVGNYSKSIFDGSWTAWATKHPQANE